MRSLSAGPYCRGIYNNSAALHARQRKRQRTTRKRAGLCSIPARQSQVVEPGGTLPPGFKEPKVTPPKVTQTRGKLRGTLR